MSDSKHRRITLVARPQGAPEDADFAFIEDAVPFKVCWKGATSES